MKDAGVVIARVSAAVQGWNEDAMTAAPGPAPRRRGVSVHVSTVLLLLAMLGMLLRLSGGAAWLLHWSTLLGLLLCVLAPIWAVCGSMAASVYLMLSMARPYNALQHLVEMAAGAVLTMMMLPVF
jgi:hypothetical protein